MSRVSAYISGKYALPLPPGAEEAPQEGAKPCPLRMTKRCQSSFSKEMISPVSALIS